MVPGLTNTASQRCTCGGGTCACVFFQQWGTTSTVVTLHYPSYGSSVALPPPDCTPRLRQGWRLEATRVAEEPKPVPLQRERRAVPAPEVVGAGAMRRRWR